MVDDNDGLENLTLTFVVSDTSKTTMPTWLEYNPKKQMLFGTPSKLPSSDKYSSNTLEFSITATDPYGENVILTLRLSVTENTAPKLASAMENLLYFTGQKIAFSLDGYFTDADGDSLVYYIMINGTMNGTLPDFLLWQASSHSISGVAPSYETLLTLFVLCSDSKGKKANTTFTLTVVKPANVQDKKLIE